jgi:hypothetical protein
VWGIYFSVVVLLELETPGTAISSSVNDGIFCHPKTIAPETIGGAGEETDLQAEDNEKYIYNP